MKRGAPSMHTGNVFDRAITTQSGIHPRSLWVGEELAFELCNIGITHTIRVINIGNKHFASGADVVHYRILFSPPISGSDALGNGQLIRRAALRICRKGNLKDHHLFMWLRPKNWDGTRIHLPRDQDSHRVFWDFATHQLEVDTRSHCVMGMYITLENNQLSYDEMGPRIEPHVDMVSQYIIPAFGKDRYRALQWYPLDPDDQALEGVQMSEIQQRTPPWFNIRPGQTSGSKAGKSASGFWVQRDEDEKLNYMTMTIDEQVRYRVRKRNRMRFGRIHEDDVAIIQLHNYTDMVFFEQGYVTYDWPNVPNAPKAHLAEYVTRWGASPDGVGFIPGLSWETFPNHIREAYENDHAAAVDPRYCVLEYKCSYTSTKLPDYYLVQLYWEMMATNTCHCYLLRYKRRRGLDIDGVYKTLRECNSYHILRNPTVEMVFIRNVLYTIQMLQKYPELTLAKLIQSDPKKRYSSCRAMCKTIAASIKARPMTIPNDELNAYDKLRWNILQNAKNGAKRLSPLKARTVTNDTKKKPRYTVQRDAMGDPARSLALVTIEDRLRTIQRVNENVDNDEEARRIFLRLCKEQQETYRLLAEEMIRIAPHT